MENIYILKIVKMFFEYCCSSCDDVYSMLDLYNDCISVELRMNRVGLYIYCCSVLMY